MAGSGYWTTAEVNSPKIEMVNAAEHFLEASRLYA
jgi:hypothetical protein